jgi:acid stress-induced BolA-like protein IbaG/YrbA
MATKAIRKYLAELGKQGGKVGGKATGKVKVRGDSNHYKALAAKATRARKAKAKRTADE